MSDPVTRTRAMMRFSALQRAEIAEIAAIWTSLKSSNYVSVLFNEPKLLKCGDASIQLDDPVSFSALQRAEIAEITNPTDANSISVGVSVLFNEPKLLKSLTKPGGWLTRDVSVLFNEPKLLKSRVKNWTPSSSTSFSALQRAEIAEIRGTHTVFYRTEEFQCSSTSRNC